MIQTRYFTKKFFLRKMEQNYHPVMIITLNNKPARFLIDTGAGTSVIGIAFIDEFELKRIGKIPITTTGVGSTEDVTYKVKVSKFKIQNKFIIENFKINTMNLDYVNDYYNLHNKQPIHGIIGSDFLNKYKAVISYINKTIEFSKIETL